MASGRQEESDRYGDAQVVLGGCTRVQAAVAVEVAHRDRASCSDALDRERSSRSRVQRQSASKAEHTDARAES